MMNMPSGHKYSPVFILLSTQQQQQQIVLLLLCLLAFMMLPFSTSSTSGHVMAGCMKSERDALLAFKAEIIYDNDHRISSWGDLTDDCCYWAGVRCDNSTGHVIQLDLNHRQPRQFNNNIDYYYYYHHYYYHPHHYYYYYYYYHHYYNYNYYYSHMNDFCYERGLSGNISSSLAGLKHLRYLDLSCNFFVNITIPKFLGSLANLVHLDLSYSYFIGVIPYELGNLTRLSYLNLRIYNPFQTLQTPHIDDAEWLSGLSSLRYLIMDGVELYRATNLMQSLNKLHHLKEVSLFECSMKSIPESLPYLNFTSLTFMEIGDNMFDNTSIPEWLFRIPNLRVLGVRFCGWTGTVPSSVEKATSLQGLDLSRNSGISGDMPIGFGNLCNLQWLFLGGTFVGKSLEEFTDAFSGCIRRNLIRFSFRSSSLKGHLPDWLGEFRNLIYLNLFANSFDGFIPESLGRLSRLQYLYLGNNTFEASIPESLGQLSNLIELDLGYINFNYSFVITEAHLANLTNLKMLQLDHANLVLNISNDWVPGFQAQYIDLSDCQVGPKFPVWLTTQVNLEYLDISNTRIKDSMPDWFWRSTHTMANLDLSNNEITGKLPQRLKFQIDQEYFFRIILNSNLFKRSIPYFPPNVVILDLSNNSLSGVIPSDLGNFAGGGKSSYLAFLSFSSNNLTGTIPSSLCNFTKLEVLDLSNNHLEGVIPNCWNNLRYLKWLILANNSLESEIPASLTSSSQVLKVLVFSNNHLHGEFPSFLKKCTSLITLALDHNNLSGNLPAWVGETMTSLMILTLKGKTVSLVTCLCYPNSHHFISWIFPTTHLQGAYRNPMAASQG